MAGEAEGSNRHDDLSVDAGLSDQAVATQLASLLDTSSAPAEDNADDGLEADNHEEELETEAVEEDTGSEEEEQSEEEVNEHSDDEEEVLEDIFEFELSDDESVELTLNDVRNISTLRTFMQENDISDIADVTGGVMKNADYTQKTQQLAQQRTQLEERIAAYDSSAEEFAGKLEVALGFAEANLKQFDGVDWQKLRDEDPIEFADRYQAFVTVKEQHETVQNTIQEFVADAQAKRQEQHEEYLRQEGQKLMEADASFRDPEQAKVLGEQMRNYLVKQGFAQEEATLTDHRHILILQKAMAFDKLQADKQTAKKKVQPKSPKKVVKAGTKKSKAQKTTQRKTDAFTRVQQTGGRDDNANADLFREILNKG